MDLTHTTIDMKKLSSIIPEEQMVQCPECKGYAFFDWGIQLEFKISIGPGRRNKDLVHGGNVKICAECLHPVIGIEGDSYDASEYISKERIEQIIARGAGLHAAVMDP